MSSYDFSPTYNSSVISFSPGSTFVATAHLDRIIVRSTTTLQIVRTWHCLHGTPSASASASSSKVAEIHVDSLTWSSDGVYILAYASKASSAWVFGLAEEGSGQSGEVVKIGEGIEGMVGVEWGRGSRDILVWSDHGIKLTIHDLTTGIARVLQYPKSATNCHTYSPEGRYMAIAERHSGKDHVGIYDIAEDYQLIRHFPLQTTDVQGLVWSPCGSFLAAHDSVLHYSVHIYSPMGLQLSHFCAESSTFSPTAQLEDPGLGIRSIVWAPGGRWLAISGWDGRVRILESEGWRCVTNIGISTRVVDKDTAIWKEPKDWITETRGRGIVQFDRQSAPITLPTIRPDLSKYPPKTGISHISFSPNATHLLLRSETQPSALHIYTFLPHSAAYTPAVTHLTTMIFASPVKAARWSPEVEGRGKRLAVCTRSGAVYIWDGELGWVDDGEDVTDETETRGGLMEGIGIPTRTNFVAHDIRYSPDGRSLAVMDKSHFCVMYEIPSESAGIEGEECIEGERTVNQSWLEDDRYGLSHVFEEDEEEEFDDGGVANRGVWGTEIGMQSGLGMDMGYRRDIVA